MFTRQKVVERAITAAYLYSGFEEAQRRPGISLREFASWYDSCGGNIGIVEAIAEFAFDIEEILDTTPIYSSADCPRVLAYEVIKPLGAWLFEQASPPSDEEFRQHFHAEMSTWLGVPSPNEMTGVPVNRALASELEAASRQISDRIAAFRRSGRAYPPPVAMSGNWLTAEEPRRGIDASHLWVNDSIRPTMMNANVWFEESATFSGATWPDVIQPMQPAKVVDLETWKDQVSSVLFARHQVSIDDIGMADTQLLEHASKSPVEFADWYAQRGTV